MEKNFAPENDAEERRDRELRVRRDLLGTGAKAAAAAFVGALALACGDEDDDRDNAGGDGDAGGGDGDAGTGPDADIAGLNSLLTAEYQAIAAYTAGAGLINQAPMSDPLYALRGTIVAIATDFLNHHTLHAEALSEAVEGLGGTAVKQADVTFTPPADLVANPTILNILKFAAGAERGAAVSYNQVLSGLEDAKYRLLASSIEGDESQHFIVLAALVLGLASPTAALTEDRADDVVPQAFVTSIGTEYPGLNEAPPDYFG